MVSSPLPVLDQICQARLPEPPVPLPDFRVPPLGIAALQSGSPVDVLPPLPPVGPEPALAPAAPAPPPMRPPVPAPPPMRPPAPAVVGGKPPMALAPASLVP